MEGNVFQTIMGCNVHGTLSVAITLPTQITIVYQPPVVSIARPIYVLSPTTLERPLTPRRNRVIGDLVYDAVHADTHVRCRTSFSLCDGSILDDDDDDDDNVSSN